MNEQGEKEIGKGTRRKKGGVSIEQGQSRFEEQAK